MYDAINSIVPDAAFTIFTGDIVDHAIWNTTQSYNTESSKSTPTTPPKYPFQLNSPQFNMRMTP
jgi:sphingomyelin phosphodiesterase